MRKSIYVSKGEISEFLTKFKGEEKQLSESLHRNLHAMMRFYEPTKEFLRIFEPHMFVKSNPLAFRYVIHYIFNCLDAEEFKKRFRWPVPDHAGDVNFRESTLDYMNHLNNYHKLELVTLTKANICVPGGLKFIKIIHKFTSFIMKQEIAKSKYGLLPNINEIPEADEKLVQLEEYVEKSIEFATKLEASSEILKQRNYEIVALMKSFFGITDDKQCWECVAQEWQVELDGALENEIKPYLERMYVFNNLAGQFSEFLIKYFVDRKENVVQFDKEKLAIAQNFVKKFHINLEQMVDRIVEKNSINFENLFKVFAEILPSIMNKIEIFKFRNDEALQFEHNEIEVLDTKALKLQNEMNDVEKSIEPLLRRDEEKFKAFCMINPAIPPTLMHTPAINRQINNNRIKNRLPMMNNGLSQMRMFKKPLPLKTKISDGRSFLVQSSHNRLSSLDSSLAILSKKSRSNISNLGNSSTPKPSMNRIRAMSSNLVGNATATPNSTVDRFRQSYLQENMRSPSRRHLAPVHNVSTKDDDVFTSAPQ